MSGRERERGSLESLLISIAVHLAVILLVPYVEQPILDVYPLDIAGVIEITTIEAAPAAPAPAPGVVVQEVAQRPKPEAPEPAKPEPVKPTPAPAPKVTPKPEPKVAAGPEPTRQEPPKQEKPEVVTSPAGRVPSPVVAKDPPESKLPEPKPTPEPTPELTPEPTPEAVQKQTPSPAAESPATQVAEVTRSPGAGQPDGVGTIPRPEYPGDDPTGRSMMLSTGGGDHGVWIPKGVQNLRGRGEAMVRIRVRADGSIESISFLESPPDPAMTQAIRSAITTAWRFAKDSTSGRAESYYLDVRVGYDGGTGDIWVKSERASYIR